MKLLITILGFGMLLLSSCYYDNEVTLYGEVTDCEDTGISYADVVLPILESKCYGCHNDANYMTIGAGVALEGHTKLKPIAISGAFVASIKGETSIMPPSGNPVSECNISKIVTWVTEGAKDN